MYAMVFPAHGFSVPVADRNTLLAAITGARRAATRSVTPR